MFLTIIKNANLALAFFLELGVLAIVPWPFGVSRQARAQLPGSPLASAPRQWL
jgi:hypothetical protein